jgi:hypothetical protein
LFDELKDLFRYAEPAPSNQATHSHRIRELLILACTELESCWRGVCVDNMPGVTPELLSTSQYVRLAEPLGLRSWRVSLADYPDYPTVVPFKDWDSSAPTKSLRWYDAYNATKHDREANFTAASYENLVVAMAALHVELSAQWGPQTFDRMFEAVPSPFTLEEQPNRGAGELYAPAIAQDDLSTSWNSIPYFPPGRGVRLNNSDCSKRSPRVGSAGTTETW